MQEETEQGISVSDGEHLNYGCPKCGHRVAWERSFANGEPAETAWSDGSEASAHFCFYVSLTRCKKCKTFFWLEEATFKPVKISSAEYPLPMRLDECYAALNEGVYRNKEEELKLRTLAWWCANDAVREDVPGDISWGCLLAGLACVAATAVFQFGWWIRSALWFAGATGVAAVVESVYGSIKHKRNAPAVQQKQDKAFEALLQDPNFERNLRTLIPLLDEMDNPSRLRKAEAYRQLGAFDKAIETLVSFQGNEKEWAQLIRNCAVKEDRRVHAVGKLAKKIGSSSAGR